MCVWSAFNFCTMGKLETYRVHFYWTFRIQNKKFLWQNFQVSRRKNTMHSFTLDGDRFASEERLNWIMKKGSGKTKKMKELLLLRRERKASNKKWKPKWRRRRWKHTHTHELNNLVSHHRCQFSETRSLIERKSDLISFAFFYISSHLSLTRNMT